jgi:hypothetical protein
MIGGLLMAAAGIYGSINSSTLYIGLIIVGLILFVKELAGD